jgi:hypothetical protein
LREEVEIGEARAALEEEGPRVGEAARGAGGGSGEEVADGDGLAGGGLGAVPGAADEGRRAPVPRRVEELEHRLEHVVEDLVRGRRRAGALGRRLVLVLLRHRARAGSPRRRGAGWRRPSGRTRRRRRRDGGAGAGGTEGVGEEEQRLRSGGGGARLRGELGGGVRGLGVRCTCVRLSQSTQPPLALGSRAVEW